MKRIILGIILGIFLILEIFLIAVVITPQLAPNSRSFNRAFVEWYKNPTPETELRKKHLADEVKREVLIIQISIWIT